MHGHPNYGQWWEAHYDQKRAVLLNLVLAFMESNMYQQANVVALGVTMAIHQVDNVMVSAADVVDHKVVINGITSCTTFKISPNITTLFYATNIEHTALYICVHAQSYVIYCLTKLGWEADSKDYSLMVPLSPSNVKEMTKSPGPLDPAALALMVTKFGFKYRSQTGMLIFAVQIGRFDFTPVILLLSKYSDHSDTVHFLAVKTVIRCTSLPRLNMVWSTGSHRANIALTSLAAP
jgi:hypothetical protein